MNKELGFIGLGRMGSNMVEHLLESGYDCVVTTDKNEEALAHMKEKGARGTMELGEMVGMLTPPRVVWLMVPRHAVDNVLLKLTPLLSAGDTIIEGGNSYYKDSMRRAKELQEQDLVFMDVGVSGGVEGARHGACMMIGGDPEVFSRLERLFADLCVKDGYGYMGTSGAGHFVKMIHNAIEYGMMGAIAEGMQIIEQRKSDFGTDLKEVVKVYGHGSIVAGRLVSEWLAQAWQDDPGLTKLEGVVPYGETEEEMEKIIKQADVPVLEASVAMRVGTRKNPSFAGKVVNALRFQFGGHTKETASKKMT